MAYSKIPLPCGDYPFGKNDLNQLIENNDVLYDSIAEEHGITPGPASINNWWSQPGRHNSRLISKTVLKLSPVEVNGARTVDVLSFPTPALVGVTSPSVGEVSISLGHIGRRRAIAQAEQIGNSVVRWASLGWDSLNASYYGAPMGVLLYEDGALADFPFYVVIWEP